MTNIYDNVDSVCCNKCDKWIHKTCAKISDKNKDMQENKLVKKSSFAVDVQGKF